MVAFVPDIKIRHVGTGIMAALLCILPMVLIGKAADGVPECRSNCTLCVDVRSSLTVSAVQMTILCVCLLILSLLFVFCVYKKWKEYYGGLVTMYLALVCVGITASVVCARFTPSCMSVAFSSSSFSTTSLFLLFTIVIMYSIAHTQQELIVEPDDEEGNELIPDD